MDLLIKALRLSSGPIFVLWTCYSPKDYFDDHKDHDTIKFEGKTLATRFNSMQYTDGQSFTTFSASGICGEFLEWLAVKADSTAEHGAQAGDSIIIIILAHGSWAVGTPHTVGIRLGHNDILVTVYSCGIVTKRQSRFCRATHSC